MKKFLIFSCEHGGNTVPPEYEQFFQSAHSLLQSHRGYDPGALELAKELSKHFHAPLFSSTVTRLLVDLNRSLTNPSLLSEITKHLPQKTVESILENYYFPYRNQVSQQIQQAVQQGAVVLHLSVHSFTPVLKGEERKADIGLLYDPQCQAEKEFCEQWKYHLESLKQRGSPLEEIIIRKNYPYQGNSDGLTTHLRTVYGEKKYLGIELEVNQKYPLSLKREWLALKQAILESLALVI